MIKKFLLTLAVVALPFIASAQTVKIGLVNTQAVLTAMPEYTEGQKQFEALQQKLNDQLTSLQNEGQRMLEEYQKLPEDEPAAIRERKVSALQQHDETIQKFMQSAQNDLNKKQQEIMQTIQMKMNPAIESVGKEGNFTLILPLDSGEVLYYGTPASDITNDVLKKLGL